MAFIEENEKGELFVVRRIGNEPKAKRRERTIHRIILARQTISIRSISFPKRLWGKRYLLKLEEITDERNDD